VRTAYYPFLWSFGSLGAHGAPYALWLATAYLHVPEKHVAFGCVLSLLLIDRSI
jgi:hypothetical protein